MSSNISTQPLKGFRDFLPEDIQKRNYIFDTWRQVCKLYGFEEYDGPVLEKIDIYNKSGDDVGTLGKELYSFEDNGGRKVALRPEMTPSVGRMVAEYGNNMVKPIKWFSIAQFYRAEKPQRGRGREFFQLNADIFGIEGVLADFEIVRLMLDIMLKLGATEDMFVIKISNRKFADWYFNQVLGLNSEDKRTKLLKILDAYPKKSDDWLKTRLKKEFEDPELLAKVKQYLNLNIDDLMKFEQENQGAKELVELFDLLKSVEMDKYCEYDPVIARGFDYYTGVVFEVFDKNPENNRSMFGGGRYDNLMDVFEKPKIPAVGVAPGDMTTQLFLESWGLMPEFNENRVQCLVTVFQNEEQSLVNESVKAVGLLRKEGIKVDLFLDVQAGMAKQMKYANRKNIPWVVVIGSEEVKAGKVSLKNMETGEQEMVGVEEVIMKLT